MAQQMLGDFHISPQLPQSHIPQSQFQQEIVQEIIQQCGPTQNILFKPTGEIGTPERHVLAIKSNLSRIFGTSPISLTL
jgi:hypothetical protein